MPIPGGTAGAHDDAMHQGSAKRDVVNGVAGLDGIGRILTVGPSLMMTREGTDRIYVYERTSNEMVMNWHRIGADDYEIFLKVAGVGTPILHAGNKDIVNGIAALGAGGQLLAPGSDIELTRDGSENIEVVERTSGDIVYRWTRIGANDYECRINCGGVACKMLNDSLINAVNGIAGLDANVLLSPTLLPPCLEDYSNHLGAVDNFTQTSTGGNGVAAADAANHEMDLSTGINAIGHSLFETKKAFTPGSQIVVANFILQNIVNGVVDNRRTYIGLKDDFTVIGTTNGVYFSQLTDGTWEFGSSLGGISAGTAITAIANGDHCTMVSDGTDTDFYVNHVLVGSESRDMTAQTLKCGVSVHADNAGISTARTISVDMMSIRQFV